MLDLHIVIINRDVVSRNVLINYTYRVRGFGLGDEMRQTVSIVVDLATAFDPDGVDVYFLNRQPMYNVRSSQQLIPMFELAPEGKSSSSSISNIVFKISGPTPIVRVLRQIFKEKQDAIKQRKLVLLIATDGAPTDDGGHLQIKELYNTLKYERGSDNPIPVTIIACTGK